MNHRNLKLAGLALLAAAAFGAAACDSGEPAPLFEVNGTGSLSGLLFYDANGDGRYDPSSGDTTVKNLRVGLYQRGTATLVPGTQVNTDASGRFSITNVPVGTLALFIDTAGVKNTVRFCQNPIPVDVYVNETQFANVVGKKGCLVRIPEAKLQPLNSVVTVSGIVTALPNQISATAAFWYIQSNSGGMELFSVPTTGRTVAVGDSIEVTGTLTTASNEFEVINGTIGSLMPNVRQVQPEVVTTKQAAAPTTPSDPLFGTLVQIRAAKQTTAFAAGAGRNATFDDGSGPVTVRIESGLITNSADVATRYPQGKCYNLTGILRNFSTGPQITPRTLTEIVEVPCP